MRESCDKHGEFKRVEGKEEGKPGAFLEFKEYVILRSIIVRQSARAFRPKRDECDQKKLEALKAGDDAEYVKVFREGNKAQNDCVVVMTAKACSHAKVDPRVYGASNRAYMAGRDKNKKGQIQLADAVAIRDLEPPLPEIEEEVAIKALKEKLQRDLIVFRMTQQAKHQSDEKAIQEMFQVEMCKTSDQMKIDYGFTLADLLRNV